MFLSSVNRSESLAEDAKAGRWLGRVRLGGYRAWTPAMAASIVRLLVLQYETEGYVVALKAVE
jgi:hypothetical protein